jgi:NitT/TauT family transport system permease protein
VVSQANLHDATFSAADAKPERGQLGVLSDPGNILAGVILTLLLVGWELSVRAGMVHAFMLPAPSNLLNQFFTDVVSPTVLRDVGYTFSEIALGFAGGAALGVGLGAAIALLPIVEKVVWPYVITLQTIPKVAIAPLLIIWFGFGIESKILIVALICFFPILVNAVAGFKSTDQRQLLLMGAMDATRWQVFRTVRLPTAVPFLIAGFRIAVVVAVIGAVVGEFLGASVGLGALIITRQANMDVTGVFSVLAMLSLIGLAMNLFVNLLSRRLAFWADTNVRL